MSGKKLPLNQYWARHKERERIARIEAQSVLMNNDYQAAKAELEKLLKEKEKE